MALLGSKIKLFVIRNPIIVEMENKTEDKDKGFLSFFIAKKVPEAAMPNNAMLTTIKAKWYHWLIEKNLIKLISKANVANEIRNIPR